MTAFLIYVLLPVALVGSLFCLLAWAVTPLLARLKAATRRRVWVLALLLMLLPVHLFALLPGVSAARQAPDAPADATLGEVLRTAPPTAPVFEAGQALGQALRPAAGQCTQPGEKPLPAADSPPQPAAAPAWSAGDIAAACGWAWLAVAAVLAALAAARYMLLMRRLRRAAKPLAGEEMLREYTALCAEMDIRHPPALLQSANITAPLLAGLRRPAILLPLGDSRDESLYALRHELCHHRGRDLPLKLLAQLAVALHWYNPLAWLLRARLATACEECCDERVAQSLDAPARRAYAAALIGYAGPSPYATVASSFASPVKKLQGRLRGLLHPARPSRAVRALSAAALCLALAACLLVGCSLAAGGAASKEDAPTADEKLLRIAQDELGRLYVDVNGDGMVDEIYFNSLYMDTNGDGFIDAGEKLSAIQAEIQQLKDVLGREDELHALQEEQNRILAATTTTGLYLYLPAPDSRQTFSLFSSPGSNGVVFGAWEGDRICAAATGTVEAVHSDDTLGHSVSIDHGNGMRTTYGFGGTLNVQAGDVVQLGDVIACAGALDAAEGYINSVGFSTWPDDRDGPPTTCLLFEYQTIATGEYLNPLDYIGLPDYFKAVGPPPWKNPTGDNLPEEVLQTLLDDSGYLFPAPDATWSPRGIELPWHRGLDINGAVDTPIYAVADGEVVSAEYHWNWGYNIVIQHADGMQTRYAHCSALYVQAGDTVKQGDMVALMGSTGVSSGTHLHLEFELDGVLLDPMDFLTAPEGFDFYWQ